ncbi:MAG: leucine-rich repeat domain-containing protein, partial [Pseudomonadota bacterium]
MSEATQKPGTGSPGAGSPVTGSLAWPFTPQEGLAEARRRIEVEADAKSGTLDIGGLQLNEEMLGELAPAIARLDWLEALYLGAGEDARKKPLFERSMFDKKLCNAARALPGALVDAASPRLTLLDLDGLGLGHLPERIAALTGLTSLNLRDNRIDADGARALAALTGLTSFDLGGNSDINLSALCALQKLQSIQLDGYKISDPCP